MINLYYTNKEIDFILNMEYNPKYKYQNEDIYCNDVFDIQSNIDIINKEMSNWRYNKERFVWGKENKRIFPSLMIYLILSTFKYKQVISYDMYEQVVLDKCRVIQQPYPFTDEQILKGRSYQTYVSYLREMDAMMKLIKLYPSSKIYKNPYLDICEGIDIKVDIDNTILYIAVKHEGRTSSTYNTLWKDEKERLSTYTIKRVTAKHNNGDLIDLVNIDDLL